MSSSQPLLIPDIGDLHDVVVIEILVKPGDKIVKDQSLITVESDKTSMEIPSGYSGTLESLSVSIGDRVNHGSVIGQLQLELSSTSSALNSTLEPKKIPTEPHVNPTVNHGLSPQKFKSETLLKESSVGAGSNAIHATPFVRKTARLWSIDLGKVNPSGNLGRILLQDLQKYVRDLQSSTQGPSSPPGAFDFSISSWPSVDFSKFGPISIQPQTRIQQKSSSNLHRNWVRIPHVTQHEEAIITSLEQFRKQLNQSTPSTKFTLLCFLIKAISHLLQQFPTFNASLNGTDIILKHYINIGFAVDTPQGLVVPVIRDVPSKTLTQIATEMSDLSQKARSGQLTSEDMSGGTFTISSLGGIGGTFFTPIINAPEVAILGVSKASMKPVWNDTQFNPELVLGLSLSYDHRVIDGALAARFCAKLSHILQDYRLLMV